MAVPKKKATKCIRHKFSRKRRVLIKGPDGKTAATIETQTDCKIPILIRGVWFGRV
jgi:rRNA processing protein Krr1/Pno1